MSLQYVQKTTVVNLLTTELNSLAPGTGALGSAVNNLAGGGTTNLDGFTKGLFELILAAPPEAFAAGVISLYLLRSTDGTDFETGSSSVSPKRLPDVVFNPIPNSSAQRLFAPGDLPAGHFRALLVCRETAALLASSGNTLRVLAQTTADA
jgi:hypothetical protein